MRASAGSKLMRSLERTVCTERLTRTEHVNDQPPNPPALLTVEASRQPLHHIIPACMSGYIIFYTLQMRLLLPVEPDDAIAMCAPELSQMAWKT